MKFAREMLKITLLCLLCELAPYCAGSASDERKDVRCVVPVVPHGRLHLSLPVYRPGDSSRLVCRDGYRLSGPDRVVCGGDGAWRSAGHPDLDGLPECRELSCPEPRDLESGRWEVEGIRTADGARFKHGSRALYRCSDGFRLPDGVAPQRVCTNGAWRGEEPVCVRTGCSRPPPVTKGYYRELSADGEVSLPRRRQQYEVGSRVVYRCDPAHVLVGTDTYQCMTSGEWSPPVAPGCQPERPAEPEPAVECGLPQPAPLTVQRQLSGQLTERGAAAGTVVEYQCTEGTRDRLSPCRPQRLTCWGGRWRGVRPRCQAVAACAPPPRVAHGAVYGSGRQPGAEVFYTCEAGFRLLGPRRLTCDAGGCWSPPHLAPVCEPEPAPAGGGRPLPLSPAAIALLAVTAAVVLLLVALLAVLLQRRAWKPLRRPPPPPPPGPGRPEDADRVALIAYPEGSQYVLPTYEEAVRADRAVPPACPEPAAGHPARAHHHRSLPPAARRERLWRREQESDSVSQRSVQSHHSASTRQSTTASTATPSLLDSMGSTDTMATSDAASTTLSAAATASVRGMCGSLASFDTSSVLNTEGVPLLEENETELETAEQQDSLSCGKSSAGDAASNK